MRRFQCAEAGFGGRGGFRDGLGLEGGCSSVVLALLQLFGMEPDG